MDKFVRYCPKCNKKLTYSTGRAKRMADSKNSKCKSCTFKSEVSMSRNCPKCSKEIVYTNRNSARVAAKKNSICHSCSMSHDIPLTRDCPNCGKLLTYISKMTRQWAAKNNSPCKSCGQKLNAVNQNDSIAFIQTFPVPMDTAIYAKYVIIKDDWKGP